MSLFENLVDFVFSNPVSFYKTSTKKQGVFK